MEVEYYLFTGTELFAELFVTNNTFHWLNSNTIWLQRLTSVELTISHR